MARARTIRRRGQNRHLRLKAVQPNGQDEAVTDLDQEASKRLNCSDPKRAQSMGGAKPGQAPPKAAAKAQLRTATGRVLCRTSRSRYAARGDAR